MWESVHLFEQFVKSVPVSSTHLAQLPSFGTAVCHQRASGCPRRRSEESRIQGYAANISIHSFGKQCNSGD